LSVARCVAYSSLVQRFRELSILPVSGQKRSFGLSGGYRYRKEIVLNMKGMQALLTFREEDSGRIETRRSSVPVNALLLGEEEKGSHFTRRRNLSTAGRMGRRSYLFELVQFGNRDEKFCKTAVQTNHDFLANVNRRKNCPL